MTGLVGNISIPAYSGSQVTWEGEIADAKDGAGTFSEVKLEPHRLTAYIDLSKQFLIQDSVSAEEMLKRDLKNKEKEGVVETESGLQYKVLVEGTGISPESADTVEVHYEGRLLDGTVFDSSRERGESIEFALNRVIKGWTEGLTYAKEGGQIELYIPADLAYGKRGSGPIPGNATLIFNIELIKVKKFAAEEEAPVEKANVKKPNVKSQSANPIDKSASKKPTIKK